MQSKFMQGLFAIAAASGVVVPAVHAEAAPITTKVVFASTLDERLTPPKALVVADDANLRPCAQTYCQSFGEVFPRTTFVQANPYSQATPRPYPGIVVSVADPIEVFAKICA